MDEETRKNIFYKPDNAPDRHYESDIVFQPDKTVIDKPETPPTPTDIITPDTRTDDLIDNLTLLLDVEDVLPPSVRTIVKDITKILIAITIVRKNEPEDGPKSDEEIPIEPVPDEGIDTHIDIEPIPDEDANVIPIDDIFPGRTDIEIVPEKSTSLSDIVAGSYMEDLLGLKEDYVSTMYLIIQKYIQEMLCAANNAAMGYENLMLEYDGDAVSVSDPNLKHLNDTIIRNQVAIDEESRAFAKTHSSDNTLTMIRSLETAYQQKRKYYAAQYR